jgi:hypothetical protein
VQLFPAGLSIDVGGGGARFNSNALRNTAGRDAARHFNRNLTSGPPKSHRNRAQRPYVTR